MIDRIRRRLIDHAAGKSLSSIFQLLASVVLTIAAIGATCAITIAQTVPPSVVPVAFPASCPTGFQCGGAGTWTRVTIQPANYTSPNCVGVASGSGVLISLISAASISAHIVWYDENGTGSPTCASADILDGDGSSIQMLNPSIPLIMYERFNLGLAFKADASLTSNLVFTMLLGI